MGTLEIRQSSASVRPLGSFRMPELDNGASSGFEAQARAAQAAANAARVAGEATVHGIARRGQIVANTLEGLGKLALEFADRENQRVATNAILAKRQDRNRYMYGDGTAENPGQFNAQFDDARVWLDGLREENVRMDEHYEKDLNSAQRRLYREAMAKDEVEWQLRIGSHAAKRTLRAQTDTAVAVAANAKDEAIRNFTDPAFRDAKVHEYFAALEREYDVRSLSEGERALERKNAAEDFCTTLATRTFQKWAEKTSGNADPEAVKAEWEKMRKTLLDLDGEVPAIREIRDALGSDALDEAHRTLLARRFEEARDRAVSASQTLKSQNQRKVQDDLVMREQSLFKEPPPEDEDGIVGGMTSKAMSYAKFADEAEAAGLGRVALSYRRTADALREGAKDYRRTAARERQAENAALQKTVYETTASDFDLGGYYRDDGRGGLEWVEENAWERQERAAALYKGGKINYVQFNALMAKTRPEVDDTFKAVRNHVLDTLTKLVPNAIKYNSRSQGFEVSPTAKVRGSTKTQYKWASKNGSEFVTYAQIVKAMNLTMLQVRQGKLSPDKANEVFDRYAAEAIRDQRRMTVDERFEWDEKVLNAYR